MVVALWSFLMERGHESRFLMLGLEGISWSCWDGHMVLEDEGDGEAMACGAVVKGLMDLGVLGCRMGADLEPCSERSFFQELLSGSGPGKTKMEEKRQKVR